LKPVCRTCLSVRYFCKNNKGYLKSVFTGKRFATVLTILAMMLALCVSCDRYVRYRALSIVFDGVPNPDLPTVIDNMTAEAISQKKVLSVSYEHPSGQGKGKCVICHGDSKGMIQPPVDICLICHTDINKAAAFIHGPAVIDCTACHDVHKSTQKTLVRKADPFLCFDCHYIQNRKRMYDTEGHLTLLEYAPVCLPCHDPHGGKDRFFIKSDDI
jgi:predicted CXXCH cytochrome family protein